MLRPVVLGLVGLTTSSCSLVESDPNRFEAMAQAVAEISLDGEARPARTDPGVDVRPPSDDAAAARPDALRVEVMEPHDLWDARDAGLRGAVERAAPAMIQAAAPAVAEAVFERVSDRGASGPSSAASPVPTPAVARTTVQLGAFSSPEAARAAWTRIAGLGAGPAMAELTPVFEPVEVDGRRLTRLKVVAGREAVRAVCRAADAADLGCLRRG